MAKRATVYEPQMPQTLTKHTQTSATALPSIASLLSCSGAEKSNVDHGTPSNGPYARRKRHVADVGPPPCNLKAGSC